VGKLPLWLNAIILVQTILICCDILEELRAVKINIEQKYLVQVFFDEINRYFV
jgi:hypothetical protein